MKIVTHNGHFHADEVFGCAALLMLYPEAKIMRSRDQAVIASGDIVLDVGGGYDPVLNRFDHHQTEGAGERDNGIPYASFGLIWKHFGKKLVRSDKAWDTIDRKLVQAIDTLDTMSGGLDLVAPKDARMHPYFIQDAIGSFNLTWKEDESEEDSIFGDVVLIARRILQREIMRIEGAIEAEIFVRQAYEAAEDSAFLLLDRHYPWRDVVAEHPETLFVIQPNKQRDIWRVQAIKSGEYSYKNRKDLPLAWAGKTGDMLASITGVPDAQFCHRSLFLATAGSKEGAIAMAKLAIAS